MGDSSGKWAIRDGDKEYVADSWATLAQWVRERRLSSAAWVLDPRTNQWLSVAQVETMAGPVAVLAPQPSARQASTPWRVVFLLLGALGVAGVLVFAVSFKSPKASREPANQTAAPVVRPGISQSPTQATSVPPRKVSYSVVKTRGKVRVVVVPPTYRNLESMRAVGEAIRDDLRFETLAIAVVFDSSKAAGMYDAMLDSPNSSLGSKNDKFYDSHLVGTFNKNRNTGLHRFLISLHGLDGPSTEITY